MNWMKVVVVVCLSALFSSLSVLAEIPHQFYYEDYCYDTNGLPFTGDISLRLQLYDAATNGTFYYEDSNTVSVVDGFYTTIIGDGTVYGSMASALASGETYVQVIIDGVELFPREPLMPQPYALVAGAVVTNAITSEMIAANAIQEQHLQDGAITSTKIATGAVTTTQLDMPALDEQFVNASGDIMAGALDMGGNSIANAKYYGDGVGITNLPGGAYTETDPVWTAAEPNYLKTDGSRAMSGELDMAGSAITNVAPNALSFSDGSHALSSSGDTMTGPLVMNFPFAPSGPYSTGILIRTTGSGPIVLGKSATGMYWSISIGHSAQSINNSIAVGSGANAQCTGGSDGVAVGDHAVASATGVAVGDTALSVLDGTVSVGFDAAGRYSTDTEGYNTAIGSSTRASIRSTVLGYSAKAQGRSIAIGHGANAQIFNWGGFCSTAGCIAIGYQANTYNNIPGSNLENIAIGYMAVCRTGFCRTAIGSRVGPPPQDSATLLRGSLYLDGGSSIYYRPQFGSGNWEWQATPHLIVTGNVDVTTIKPLCTGAELVNASTKVWWKALSGDTTNDWVRQSQDLLIRSNLTLNVPADYATIQDALSYLRDKTVASDAIVTIQVANGSYANYQTIEITHCNSDRIRILGNVTNCELCVLQFATNRTGFLVQDRKLNYLNGFKVVGKRAAGSYGIQAANGGVILCGTQMFAESFERGFAADVNSTIYASGCKACICSNGFSAANGSVIVADNSTTWWNSGFGYHATLSSEVVSRYSIASNNSIGFVAGSSSTMYALGSMAKQNSSYGFYAYLGSSMELSSTSIATGNLYGVVANYGSIVRVASASISGNFVNYFPGLSTNGNYNSLIAN